MSNTDHSTYLEWLYTEEDGSLLPAEEELLAQHLSKCESCRREKEEIAQMDLLLASSKISVGEELESQVMRRLPAAGWEARHPRNWAAAMFIVVLLGGVAAALLGTSAAQLEPAAPFLGALGSIADLLETSLLAGAGLLTASWKGLGVAVGSALQGSKANLVVLLTLVVAVDLLFLRLLLRRRSTQGSVARQVGHDISSRGE